jgi:hypothetical protein
MIGSLGIPWQDSLQNSLIPLVHAEASMLPRASKVTSVMGCNGRGERQCKHRKKRGRTITGRQGRGARTHVSLRPYGLLDFVLIVALIISRRTGG